jgi:hypothetical protein
MAATSMEKKVSLILAAHDVRLVGFKVTTDVFQEIVYKVNPHYNDLRFLGWAALEKHLSEALNVKVGYTTLDNTIHLKPI